MSLLSRRAAATRRLVAGALVMGLGALAAAPAAASEPEATPAPASSTAEAHTDPVEEYVWWVYQDLLGRDVDEVGLTTWTQALRAGTPRIAVANAITSSDEFRGGLVSEAFFAILGRDPDPVGAEGWLAAMRSGATIQQLEAGILASPEYVAGAPGGDLGWVETMYLDVLGRAATSAEAEGWVAVMRDAPGRPALSKVQVALGMLNSAEALTPRVDDYYAYLLGRGIDPTGAQEWVAAIQAGVRLELIVGGIIASDEYYALS